MRETERARELIQRKKERKKVVKSAALFVKHRTPSPANVSCNVVFSQLIHHVR